MLALAESGQVALIGVFAALASGVLGLAGVVINGRNQKREDDSKSGPAVDMLNARIRELVEDRNFWRDFALKGHPELGGGAKGRRHTDE